MIVLVGCGVLLQSALEFDREGPSGTTSGPTSESTRPTKVADLGVTRNAEGEIVIIVPECKGVRVVSVTWVDFEHLYTLWALSTEVPTKLDEIVIGEVPEGFNLNIDLDPSDVEAVPNDRRTTFVVERVSLTGVRLPAAEVSVALSEIRLGAVAFVSSRGAISYADNSEEFSNVAECRL